MTTETVLKPVSPGMGRGAVTIVFEMVFKICPLSVDSLDTKESESEVAQSCPTVCDPVDYSPPGSSIHGILQARILEWVAISFSRGSSRPRVRTLVSRIAGRRFNLCATREALDTKEWSLIPLTFSVGWN